MKTYHFLPNKQGRELLPDIGRIEKIPNFNFGAEPHQLSFYDLLFIDKGTGHFMLDDHKIALKPGTIIFTSPGHTGEWQMNFFCTASAFFINTRSQPVYSLNRLNFLHTFPSIHG